MAVHELRGRLQIQPVAGENKVTTRPIDIPAYSVLPVEGAPVGYLSRVAVEDPETVNQFSIMEIGVVLDGVASISGYDVPTEGRMNFTGARHLNLKYWFTGDDPIYVTIWLVWDTEAEEAIGHQYLGG